MMEKLNLVVNLILVCAVGFLIFKQQGVENAIIESTKSKYFYFATTEDGRLIPMVPLNDPFISRTSLLSWTSAVVTETLSFESDNYRKDLTKSSRNYTKRGWENFTQWLQRNRVIHDITVNKSKSTMLSATALLQPKVISDQVVAGRYQWEIEMPIVLKLGNKETKYNLQILVVRVPRLESEKGIGIERITFSKVL